MPIPSAYALNARPIDYLFEQEHGQMHVYLHPFQSVLFS